MAIEQALQFQQGAAGAEIRSEAEPGQLLLERGERAESGHSL